ncbi:MAG: hypothetical protein QXU75_07930 [Candidatus Methanomethylicaceae archaeon]
MNGAFVSSIVGYGNTYRQEMLGKYNSDSLLANWWLALDFFLGRACFQGRRDDISDRVYQAVIGVLLPLFGGTERTDLYQQERSRHWETIRQHLEMRIGKGKIGKGRDVEMVLSTLDFIGDLPQLNIVGYSVLRIRSGKIREHYDELQRGIVQVGPKIASFYLRDVASLYQLENFVSEEFAFCLQPIDAWVRKLVKKIGLVGDKASDDEVREAIIALCREHSVSPAQFNQGSWYLGYFAFDLLLEMLLMKAGVTSSSSQSAC